MGQNTRSYHALDWIGSLSCWIGLDWILQNGPMSNSGLDAPERARGNSAATDPGVLPDWKRPLRTRRKKRCSVKQKQQKLLVFHELGLFVTFSVKRSRGEMYSGHGRLSVCLSVAAFPHYCTDPDISWGNAWGCRLVVYYWRICSRCSDFVAMTT